MYSSSEWLSEMAVMLSSSGQRAAAIDTDVFTRDVVTLSGEEKHGSRDIVLRSQSSCWNACQDLLTFFCILVRITGMLGP